MEKRRPYIILKWAQTGDGFISRNSNEPSQVSNELAKKLLHRWRSEEDAFLVGAQTAAADNPRLNVREWEGRNPTRIVLDRSRRLDRSLHVFDGSQPTIVYDEIKDLDGIVNDLYKRKIQSVVVEGGAKTINLFIDAGLWDEARVFVSDLKFGSGLNAPQIAGQPTVESIGDNKLLIYRNDQNFSARPLPVK